MSQDETAVNTEVAAQETTATEPAPVETKTPEVADTLLEILSSDDDTPPVAPVEDTKEESKDDAGKSTDDAEESTETPETEDQPRGKAEERKQQLNTEIRDLVSQKKQLAEEIERLNAEVYKPQTVEELVEEGLSPELAEVRALKQELELQNYNNRVVEAQTSLETAAENILKEYPMFDPESPDYQEDIAANAAQALRSAFIIDPNTNQIIGSHLSPYQIYKPIADAFAKSRLQGEIKGQKATEQMLANVDAQPSATPRQAKKDPVLEILSSDD